MKTIAQVFIIGISVAFVSCTIGNGNLVTFEKNVSSFEKIAGSSSAEIRFHASQEYRAVVTVDSNLQEYVEIKTKNNELNIGTKKGHSYSFTEWVVDVYCPILTSVSMSGSGNFESMDTITVSTFHSNVSGSGKIDGTIECETFYSDVSGSGEIGGTIKCETFYAVIPGSGKMNIAGNSKNANINIAGSGNFNGNEFSIINATVYISGSGKANICVSDNLNVDISGSGDINYRGNPNVNSTIFGSGRIKKM